MPQEILINITSREVRVAHVEQGRLQEIYIERTHTQGLLGNIYKGRVMRILPGIQSAFVDIGLDRAAFLHISDMGEVKTQEIKALLRPGQDVLVQVCKNPLGSKGARLTTRFSIPFRYLVFTPGDFQVAISQKITNEAERQRLLSSVTPNQHGGYIFRTAAEGVSSADIEFDKTCLNTLWEEIQSRAAKAKPTELVYAEIPIVLRVLRDIVSKDTTRIRVDDENAAETMREFADRYVPELANRIEYYSDIRPIFDNDAIDEQLEKALDHKINLKSGGHIVIDQTEAMTTIDVNTGSYAGKKSAEQIILNTNLEAIAVIAEQLRLRNLGGIIIIDFIDMQEMAQKGKVLKQLAAALAKDNARIQISELSSLGLVQLTRKRTRESLEHILCESCSVCQGRGAIKSVKTICYEIIRQIKRAAATHVSWPGFLVIAAPRVVEELSKQETDMLAALEKRLGKPIRMRTEMDFTQEQYEVLPDDLLSR
jgi:ribonuclease G